MALPGETQEQWLRRMERKHGSNALRYQPRKRKRSKPTIPDGYAAIPGTGPKDETCASCRHRVRFRKWSKCALLRSAWTGGRKTDILAKSPACSRWDAIEGWDSLPLETIKSIELRTLDGPIRRIQLNVEEEA